LEDTFTLNLGVIEFVIKMLASIIIEVFLASGYFRREVLGLTIIPGSIWQVILLVEGTGLVVGELVISHNKFISNAMTNYN
jgi:hypothetical protein